MVENKEKSEQTKPVRLYRSETDKVIGGVAGGLGDYFGVDSTLIRLIFVLLTIFGGSGVLLYFILWLVMPSESQVMPGNEHIRRNAQEIRSKAESFANSFRGTSRRNDTRFWGGIIVITLGLMFLLDNFGIRFNFGHLWPLWLIVLGLVILMRK